MAPAWTSNESDGAVSSLPGHWEWYIAHDVIFRFIIFQKIKLFTEYAVCSDDVQ